MAKIEGKIHLIETSVAVLVSTILVLINIRLLSKNLTLNTYLKYTIFMLFLHNLEIQCENVII